MACVMVWSKLSHFKPIGFGLKSGFTGIGRFTVKTWLGFFAFLICAPLFAETPPIINIFRLNGIGGTGAIVSNGTAVLAVPPGTAGNVMTSNGTVWASQPAGAGGALRDLSNLTTTNVSQDLNFLTGADPGGPANITTQIDNSGGSQSLTVSTGGGGLSNNSGNLTIQTGDQLNSNGGNSGNLTLHTGRARSQIPGNIVLLTGNASPDSTRGLIQFQDGSEGTTGQVWTSADSGGTGHWAPGGGGGANTSLSNLGTTAVNQNLIFVTGSNALVKTADDTVLTKGLSIASGDSSGNNNSTGAVSITSGATPNAANFGPSSTGTVTLASGASNRNTGAVTIATGVAGFRSGSLALQTGTANPGNRGQITASASNLSLLNDGTNPTALLFNDQSQAQSGFKAPAAYTTPTVWVLPLADGANGQVLSTDGLGNMSWASVGVPFDFGDGSDGSATLDGVTTVPWASLTGSTYLLLRQVYLTTLTINPGITVETNGYAIFGRGVLVNSGTIDNSAPSDATAGGSGGQGSGGIGGSRAPWQTGPIQTSTSVGQSQPGQAGAFGNPNDGVNGSAGLAGGSPYGVVGGTGGNGGFGSTGTLGLGTSPSSGGFFKFRSLTTTLLSGTGSPLAGGQSGGSGASGGGDGTNNGGGGGGSGGAGGAIPIFFDTFNNNGGTIIAAGGNGAAGESPVTTSGGVGGGGGGSGGSGGFIYIVDRITVNSGTITAPGGTGGAGGTAAGTGSSNGTPGTSGSNGLILHFETSTGTWL